MTADTPRAPVSQEAATADKTDAIGTKKPDEAERPTQHDELLCTICHMPSCWR